MGAYNEHGEPDDAFNAVEELARGPHKWKYFCVVFIMPTRYTSWWSAEYLVSGVRQHNQKYAKVCLGNDRQQAVVELLRVSLQVLSTRADVLTVSRNGQDLALRASYSMNVIL